MSPVYLLSCPGETPDSMPDHIVSLGTNHLDNVRDKEISFFLVQESHQETTCRILEKVRGHSIPNVYLRPVVLVTRSENQLPEELTSSFDFIINTTSLNDVGLKDLSSRASSINRWIDALDDALYNTDRNLALKLLRFFASRNLSIGAIPSSSNRKGFIYPSLEPFLDIPDGSILETLDFMEHQRLVTGTFQTKAYFCNHCHSAFLNFKEVCVHCGSEDLSIDELVHHFKCGYIAELKDYKREDVLVCPKCDKTLRHIGVDYDKPSIVYRCNQCTHTFQEPAISSTCYNCGHSTEPENQLLRTIKKFSISALGQHAAKFGLDSLFGHVLEQQIPLMPYPSFQKYVKVEAARIERYKKTESTLLLIYLKGLETIYIRMGSRADEMFREISTIIQSVLRTSDIISAKDEAMFAIMLTDTDEDQAKRAVERLDEGLRELATNNLDGTIQLISSLHPVKPKSDPSAQFESMLRKSLD